MSSPVEEILKIHKTRELDNGGVPQWTALFASRMREIKAPDWWMFEPIIGPLRQQGYGRGVEVVRGLYGKTAIPGGIYALCRILHISYPTAKADFRRVWNVAYDRFGAQYPGIIQSPYYEQLWQSATYTASWGQPCS